MRFTGFIHLKNKANRDEPLSASEAVDWIKKNAAHTIEAYKTKKNCRIYRGAFSNHKCYLVDPSKSPDRPSANTESYYTFFINNDKSWSKYPKREIICTSSYSEAFSGDTFVVIPEDSAKVGICPGKDMWDTVTKYGGPQEVNRNITGAALNILESGRYTARQLGIGVHIDNYSKLKKLFNVFDRVKKESITLLENSCALMSDFSVSNMTFYDFYASIMNPTKLKFKSVNVGDSLPSPREVWTDAKCLLINASTGIRDFETYLKQF